MYRKHHNGQLSIEEFHAPFGGTLDPNNRWVVFSSLMPWEDLEETYAPQFSPTTGAPAKSVRLAFGALFIKQRLGLTDEETVEQIRENAYMQFFLGFAGYSSKAPFDPSMMVHFRKRFSEKDLKRINELIAERGKAMVIEAISSLNDDDSDDPGADEGTQISIDDFVKPADWPEGKNWGTLTIDASCTPADITYPTDLKLLNEARASTDLNGVVALGHHLQHRALPLTQLLGQVDGLLGLQLLDQQAHVVGIEVGIESRAVLYGPLHRRRQTRAVKGLQPLNSLHTGPEIGEQPLAIELILQIEHHPQGHGAQLLAQAADQIEGTAIGQVISGQEQHRLRAGGQAPEQPSHAAALKPRPRMEGQHRRQEEGTTAADRQLPAA